MSSNNASDCLGDPAMHAGLGHSDIRNSMPSVSQRSSVVEGSSFTGMAMIQKVCGGNALWENVASSSRCLAACDREGLWCDSTQGPGGGGVCGRRPVGSRRLERSSARWTTRIAGRYVGDYGFEARVSRAIENRRHQTGRASDARPLQTSRVRWIGPRAVDDPLAEFSPRTSRSVC